MRNVNERVLIKRFAKVTGYCENALRHTIQNGTWMGNSFVVFEVRMSRKQHQKGGTA
ncbi:hypothetical protein [Aquabacterium sp.]|uniref:hypothetical protein n=1 Tax=Aquabacterium sp. TaxID=1872578 RepID=UPI00248A54E9|nr:hypothetical protein [Aquabacterium sp.]MDI1349189.1 hypothetical protein [Aquabacterium sp.]